MIWMIESMMRMIGHKVRVARYATTIDIEVTTNVIGFDNISIHFKVDEAVLDKNQLAWFASCLVIGQVEKLK